MYPRCFNDSFIDWSSRRSKIIWNDKYTLDNERKKSKRVSNLMLFPFKWHRTMYTCVRVITFDETNGSVKINRERWQWRFFKCALRVDSLWGMIELNLSGYRSTVRPVNRSCERDVWHSVDIQQ